MMDDFSVASDRLVPVGDVVPSVMSPRDGRVLGIRVPRQYDAAAVSAESAVMTGSDSPVQQQFAEETDINTIVRRFGLSRSLPAELEQGVYGDFSGITDFESAVEMVDRARAGFMALPAEIRDRFGNDPGRLIAFAQGLNDEQLEVEFAPPAPVPAPVAGPQAPLAPVG